MTASCDNSIRQDSGCLGTEPQGEFYPRGPASDSETLQPHVSPFSSIKVKKIKRHLSKDKTVQITRPLSTGALPPASAQGLPAPRVLPLSVQPARSLCPLSSPDSLHAHTSERPPRAGLWSSLKNAGRDICPTDPLTLGGAILEQTSGTRQEGSAWVDNGAALRAGKCYTPRKGETHRLCPPHCQGQSIFKLVAIRVWS